MNYKPVELCPVESFKAPTADNSEEIFDALLQVSAPLVTPRPPAKKRGALLTLWTECGRYTVALTGEQLHWLRVELAKHAPSIEAVTP